MKVIDFAIKAAALERQHPKIVTSKVNDERIEFNFSGMSGAEYKCVLFSNAYTKNGSYVTKKENGVDVNQFDARPVYEDLMQLISEIEFDENIYECGMDSEVYKNL